MWIKFWTMQQGSGECSGLPVGVDGVLADAAGVWRMSAVFRRVWMTSWQLQRAFGGGRRSLASVDDVLAGAEDFRRMFAFSRWKKMSV
jgi:hypothetical protein